MTGTTTVSFVDSLDASDQNEELPPAELDYSDYTLDAGDGIILSAAGFTISQNKHTATRHVEDAILGTVSASVKFNDYGEKGVSLSGTVTFTDESSLSDSATVTVRVWKVTSIAVRRVSSGNEFSGSCVVAVGAVGTPEHMADVRVQITPRLAGVTVPPLVIEDHSGDAWKVDATVAGGGAETDGDGCAYFYGGYTSSDRASTNAIIGVEQEGSPTANVSQRWHDGAAGSWQYDPFFVYGVAAPVTFHPGFTDQGQRVAITSHQMKFRATEASGWHWDQTLNDGEGDYANKTWHADGEGAEALAALVLFEPSPAGDSGGGAYTSDMKVLYDADDILDVVSFQAIDAICWQ